MKFTDIEFLWLVLAVQIGRRYLRLERVAGTGEPPRLLRALSPQAAPAGQPLSYRLPGNLFHCDPGDILTISVRPVDGDKLPPWLRFDGESLLFSGTPPDDIDGSTWLTVRATNLEGQWSETRLGFTHLRQG